MSSCRQCDFEFLAEKRVSDFLTKIFFYDVLGRPERFYGSKTFQAKNHEITGALLNYVSKSDYTTPYVFVVMPHVIAGYHFGEFVRGQYETNLHKIGSAFQIAGDMPIFEQKGVDLDCPAEGVVVGQETRLRASAKTVEDYMSGNLFFPYSLDIRVINSHLFQDAWLKK